MYIKNIKIKGFRNFEENVVEFHEGINVLIGHNNAGKAICSEPCSWCLNPIAVSDDYKQATFVEMLNLML